MLNAKNGLVDGICTLDQCTLAVSMIIHYHCPVKGCEYIYYQDGKIDDHVHCRYSNCYLTKYHFHCTQCDKIIIRRHTCPNCTENETGTETEIEINRQKDMDMKGKADKAKDGLKGIIQSGHPSKQEETNVIPTCNYIDSSGRCYLKSNHIHDNWYC